MTQLEWSTTWPKTPGLYWFVGWSFRCDLETSPPELHLVEVVLSVGRLNYFTTGFFLYPEESRGVWQPACPPPYPPQELINNLKERKTKCIL